MSMLSSLFGGKKPQSPMDAANNYLNQIPETAHQGYDQYINAGNEAGKKTQSEYDMLTSDPTGFINKLMEGYKPSEGYQFQKDQLTKELGNTAAAGGIAGTPQDQMNQGKGIQQLLSGDMQQFLQNVLQQYHTGLKGEQGISDRGYDASGKLTDTLGNALNQQGGLAFQDAQQKQKNRNDIWSTFGKGLGGAAGFLAGGPLGGALGAKAGGAFAGSTAG